MATIFVRVCAALIVLRSFTNFAKVFQGEDALLVFCGQVLRGGDVVLPSVIVGAFMLVTGLALWKPTSWALPLLAIYAAYVPLNMLLWTVRHPEELIRVGGMISASTDPSSLHLVGILAMLVYAVVGIGLTAGPAWVLWQRQA